MLAFDAILYDGMVGRYTLFLASGCQSWAMISYLSRKAHWGSCRLSMLLGLMDNAPPHEQCLRIQNNMCLEVHTADMNVCSASRPEQGMAVLLSLDAHGSHKSQFPVRPESVYGIRACFQ